MDRLIASFGRPRAVRWLAAAALALVTAQAHAGSWFYRDFMTPGISYMGSTKEIRVTAHAYRVPVATQQDVSRVCRKALKNELNKWNGWYQGKKVLRIEGIGFVNIDIVGYFGAIGMYVNCTMEADMTVKA